jgi:hypothetical protein
VGGWNVRSPSLLLYNINSLPSQACCSLKESTRWTFWLGISQVLANITSESSPCSPKFQADCQYLSTPIMKSWWIQWIVMAAWWCCTSLALLFLMKVMVWNFMSNSRKVMTALIVLALRKWCCGEFFCNSGRWL